MLSIPLGLSATKTHNKAISPQGVEHLFRSHDVVPAANPCFPGGTSQKKKQ